MEPLLSNCETYFRKLGAILLMICFFSPAAFAQLEKNTFNHDDYKDKKQFEKFQKRRKTIGAWQINQLKEGALVVKLKTNKTLIDELIKNGKPELAEQKRLETYFINRNVMQAFKDNFDFCKVYFIYSSAGDSLMRGVRQGIFLDSTLRPSADIIMPGSFYLVAERDFVYNSSIGFVTEDSARFVVEKGNPSGEQAEAVVKNKYGHQLKKPFPYVCGYGSKGMFDMAFVKQAPQYYFQNGTAIDYSIDKTQLVDMKNTANHEFKKAPTGAKTYMLEKQHTYELVSMKVRKFNEDLISYYRGSPRPEMSKIDKEVVPFLY